MGKRIALVIGTGTYDDPQFAALAAPVHDVKGLVSTLRDPKVGGFDEVHELVDRSSRELQLEISNVFADRDRDDLVVVYISGHGYKDRGKLYFVCKDTKRSRLNATGVPSDYLKQEMEASAARRQVLILDCCHSGAFSAGMKSAAGVGDKAGAIDELGGDESGKIVLTASDAIQFAYEGDSLCGEAQSSVFTKHLLEGLRTGAADMDGDGSISVDELFDYVRQKVREERPDQRPQRSAAGESGDVFIARSPYIKPAALGAELLDATRSKDRLVVMGSIDELWQLLEDPDPRMVAAARQRLQEMLVEDHFRSVHDKAQEALDSVNVNVVVKPKTAKVRTGPAGPGSAGFEPAAEPDAPAGPWLRQGTGPGLVDVVLVRPGNRKAELARAIGAATGALQGDAEQFINDAPHATFPKLNQADAKRLVTELEGAGATIEVRPVRARSGSEPESSVWKVPKVHGAERTPSPPRTPQRDDTAAREAQAHAIRSARDCGVGSPVLSAAIAGIGGVLSAIVTGAVALSAMDEASSSVHQSHTLWNMGDAIGAQQAAAAGQATALGAMVAMWALRGGIEGLAMLFALPLGWRGPTWPKRIGVAAGWFALSFVGAGVAAFVSRDQPGMTTAKAWIIAGVWIGAMVLAAIASGIAGQVLGVGGGTILLSALVGGVAMAGAAFAHGTILKSARAAAR